ncbi:protein-export chaperone SecB [Paenacidovorax caeni]|uniref:protein-export chaperone SecB n=1 Tax=Paenacidovorax caeni TaxID=343013 RepID=UPI001113E891|nr:protein-export chaperone SecB [Paenacidovorax caeni]
MSNHDVANDYEGDIDLSMQRGVSDFDRNDPLIAVGIRAIVQPVVEENVRPSFHIEVELSGQFTVDYNNFDFDDLPRWAEVNAPMLLLPYVREQVYGLALRAGIKGMMIPLFVSKPGRKKSESDK